MRTPSQILNEIQIAQACSASWRAMKGDDRVRHCGQCDRKVFNLSQLSADKGVRLLEQNGYNLCVRLYQRRDGTIMTQDCGAKSVSRWRVAAWAVSLLASLFASGCRVVQGAVDVNPRPSVPSKQPATPPTHPDKPADS
ncbi:MAG: hypothetical protein K8T25_12770 [Planctomycetia bacterium]|nr:hypothetical protein [Planctomycetia bacterium]